MLDVTRFEDAVTEAREALAADPGRALARLDAGLAEWHGPVLADVADEDWARPAAVRWDELRLEALEARFDALLALGRHSEAVPELERTVDEYPLREGFARRLMIALYRSGPPGRGAARVLADARGARRRARPRPDARARRPAVAHPQPRPGPRRAGQLVDTAGRGRRRGPRRRAAAVERLAGPAARARRRAPRPGTFVGRASSSTSCVASGR